MHYSVFLDYSFWRSQHWVLSAVLLPKRSLPLLHLSINIFFWSFGINLVLYIILVLRTEYNLAFARWREKCFTFHEQVQNRGCNFHFRFGLITLNISTLTIVCYSHVYESINVLNNSVLCWWITESQKHK